MPVPNFQLGCAAGNPPRYQMRRWKIGGGDSAIRKTILHMQALVLGPEGVGHPSTRVAAIEAARGSVKNLTEIDAVLAWVKRNIEFRGENAETLQSPIVTLQLRAGDCDDHSILIAAMMRSLGYNVQFKTVAASRQDPTQFSHVYVVAQDKRTGAWKALDSTVPGSFAGWEPPRIYRSKTYAHRGMGDEVSYQPLVPIPPAPTGLSPGAQFAYNITEPIAQAYASNIAHGPTPVVTGNLNLGLGGASGIPTWAWLAGIGALIWAFTRGGGGGS